MYNLILVSYLFLYYRMEKIIIYFETIPSLHRSLILAGGLFFFWIIEGIVPFSRIPYKKLKHAGPNLFFTVMTGVVNMGLAFALVAASDYVSASEFGILHWLPIESTVLQVVGGLLILDLIGAYFAHWSEHKIKPLWMVHLVHHSDHHVDATTANRHHPIENVVRVAFTAVAILVSGASIGVIMLYQTLSAAASQFGHANIILPKKVDLWLSYILVTPNMHKVHHHYQLPYTDSNYGNIFSIWDRLFGTYKTMNAENLVYGVDTFPDAKKNGNLWELLKQPFHKYRRPTTEN